MTICLDVFTLDVLKWSKLSVPRQIFMLAMPQAMPQVVSPQLAHTPADVYIIIDLV